MVQSRFFRFSDPYAYQAAVRAADVELLVTSKGDFEAELTQIDFDRLWMQRGRDNLPRVAKAARHPTRAPIFFLAETERPPLTVSGRDLLPGEIVVYGSGSEEHQRSSGASRWAALSLTPEDLAVAGEAIAGRELVAPPTTSVIRPAAAPMARLMMLHKAAEHSAKEKPDIFARPAVAKAFEQKLMHAMVTCLTSHLPINTRSFGRHERVVDRFEDFLAARQYEPAYLAEICAALGVSERMLRTCCHEHLGMGPLRFLWLRRMHLAHRALLRGDPAAGATVTDTATSFGFWELGRFSVQYRALFGETPSASLRRPPQAARL